MDRCGGFVVGWETVRGHDRVIEGFRRAFGRGRLAHAYLFAGPAGVGKRTFAIELARALLCERTKDSLEACGVCTACILVEAGTHPDFVVAGRPPESAEFPIERMREVCQSFALKSARGRGKVVVIDDADDLNEEAANCFLKTLEEPPPRSLLILLGTSPDRQLPTVRSRCQVIRFSPLAPSLVDEILSASGIEEATRRSQLVEISGGSPGRALELSDAELWEFFHPFVKELARPAPDTVALARSLTSFLEEAGKEAPPQRRRARLVLRLLVDFLEDALAHALGHPCQRTTPADRACAEALAGRVGPQVLLVLLERCLECDRHIERNVQVGLAVEGVLDHFGQRLGR
jgi:DNA polymerase-3 subunit delta'